MKKQLSLFLALLLAVSCAAGCSESAVNSEGETPSAESVSEEAVSPEEAEDAEEELSDDLPDVKFDGRDYVIYTRSCCENHKKGVYMPEMTGEVVDDAIYERNLAVQERFDVNIPEPLLGPDGECAELNASVQAGDDMCDVAIMHYKWLGNSATSGYFIDAASVGYLGLEKPWWYQNVNDAYSFAGHYYVLVGMYDLDNYYDSVATYFNKNMFADYFPNDDLYSVVKEGKWTIDALRTYADGVTTDLNGDGKMDPTNDQYGYGMANGYSFIYQFGWDQMITERDSEGYPQYVIHTERQVQIVDTLYDLLHGTGVVILDESGGPAVEAFKNGRLLFTIQNLSASINFRDVEHDFGILPICKLDEAQERYLTHATAHTSAVAIPITKDQAGFEYSEIILEAMASEGFRQVRPAVYDVALKSKYTRDETSYEMIDIVINGRTADFAEIFDNWGLTYTLDILVARGASQDWASHHRTQIKINEKLIEKAAKQFAAIDKGGES